MKEDRCLMRTLILTGIFVSSAIALIVIIAAAYITIKMPAEDVPGVLTNWGGLIIGFYFGSFLGLVKDWISRPTTE